MLAYLDCFSGISGDMLLGALLDVGADADALRARLAALPVTGYTLAVERVERRGMRGLAARVVLDETARPVERHLADVVAIVEAGGLPPRAQQRAVAIFRRLAQAEARVHGVGVEEVHFHEVGAVDAIVDVVGTALGLELLGVDEVFCSELPLTSGRVRSAHGELPVPAPATVELLRETGAVWRPLEATGELVTPTGAAVAAVLARFERPAMRMRHVGHGFGQRELPWANCLRVMIGDAPQPTTNERAGFEEDTVTVLEANIDNMTGEALGWLMDRLLAAGALDVSYTPGQMKKNRPAVRLTVLAPPEQADGLAAVVLRESATLGVRVAQMQRMKAGRRQERITTPLGAARIKLKLIGGEVVGVAAEFDDARQLAQRHGLPLSEVIAQVEAAGRAAYSVGGTKADASTGGGSEGDAL